MEKAQESVKLTVLVDNQAGDGLSAEHGLSLWIEVGDRRILFDTGQGAALLVNATQLGVELSRADALVLSHGHYDHTGAVPEVLDAARRIEVYCHPAVTLPRYSIRDGKPKSIQSIQMPTVAKVAIQNVPYERLHWTSCPAQLFPGVGITGPIQRLTSYEDTGGPFFLDENGKQPDPIDDDMALWVKTRKGLLVCVGCGHSGLVNTLEHVRRASDISRIHAVVGGFHLLQASEERLEKTVAALRSLSPEVIVPCHCTGNKAVEMMRGELKERVSPGHAATVLEL